MNAHNLQVLTNIIGAVESGGQVYGKRRYDQYSPPYHSTPKEHTITIGWYCGYGHEAKQLIQAIFDTDTAAFRKLDTCSPSIESMLSKDWVSIKWNPSSKQKDVIIKLIDSKIGHECQDKIFAAKCKVMAEQCVELYPGTKNNIKAQMMFAEIKHLGGLGPVKRIFNRLDGDYSLDAIMASLVKDQNDKSSSNQVGDKIFWSRHVKCRQYIDQYAVDEDAKPKEVTKVTEKDIILCGHGSGTPRTIRMDTYLSNRYAQKAPNGKRKGVVAVRRYKKFTDSGRQKFHDKYSTILGRNIYSQSLRKYCYKRYKDDRYYSDCSSSCCLTLAQIGYDCPDYNTEGILTSDRFEDVPIKIENGHVTNPEVLQVGDFLLFAGNASHYKEVGHVEAIYSIGGTSYAEQVRSFQRWLNKYYSSILEAAEVGKISVDGQYGTETRAAALAVWKYMANKYYDANLTLTNRYFYESSKKAAAKMTDAEIAKHPTLEEIRDGICHGRGYKDINSFKSAKKVSDSADIWYALFN